MFVVREGGGDEGEGGNLSKGRKGERREGGIT
jgi:hypothetical protein